MRRNKLKTKMTITVPFKEAKKKGLDTIEKEVVKELNAFAADKGWEQSEIIFDAKDNDFVYSVKEAK